MKNIKSSMMRVKLMREIMNSKVRFLAITLVVIVGVTIFIASSMSYRNLETSYQYTYDQLNFADFRVKAERIQQFVVDECEAVPGVKMATPRVKSDEPFILPDDKRLVGRVTGLPWQKPIVDDLLMEEGRFFEDGDHYVCIAESHFAQFYDLHPGDVLRYEHRGTEIPVEIIGVAGSPEYVMLAGEKGDLSPMISSTAMAIIWMPVNDVQWMAELPRQYNQLLFTVDDPENMDPVIAEVEQIMMYTGITDVITREEHLGNQMLQMDLEGFQSFALFFPLLFLGVACFSIYILLSRLVHTQRPFIGVMRAIGYTKKQILSHYLSFALIIGFLGAIGGALAGFGLSYLITKAYASTIGIPMVKIKVFWFVMFQGMFLSILFCAMAGMMPALKSARIDPAKAMRGETLDTVFRKPLLERIFPPLSRIPLFLKVPVRNMFRNRRRTVFTIIGLVFSIMLVFIFLAVLNTADDALDRGFRRANKFDMAAIFLGGHDQSLISKIKKIPGVGDAEPTIGYNVRVKWDGDSSDTVMMGLLPDTTMKGFESANDGEEVVLTSNHILMNQWFETEKNLAVGDVVTVASPWRERDFIISDFISDPLGNLVYVPQEEAREVLAYGQLSRGGFYIKTLPGEQEAVREELEKLPGIATIIDLAEIKREVDNYMSLMYIIVYVMLVFALVMAFALTFNTITINILEREREIATMRTIGTESWKISAMTTLENVIFGILALVPGFILGLAVASYAINLQNSEFFSLKLAVYPSSYWLVAIGILIILLLCQIPSLRYVKGVELAEATKQRSG